eukprot:1160513-Pelagomonas_calceolata.AAC.19
MEPPPPQNYLRGLWVKPPRQQLPPAGAVRRQGSCPPSWVQILLQHQAASGRCQGGGGGGPEGVAIRESRDCMQEAATLLGASVTGGCLHWRAPLSLHLVAQQEKAIKLVFKTGC